MILSDLSRYLVFRNPRTITMKSIVSQYLKVAVKQMVSMELTGEASITFDDNIKRTTDFIKH